MTNQQVSVIVLAILVVGLAIVLTLVNLRAEEASRPTPVTTFDPAVQVDEWRERCEDWGGTWNPTTFGCEFS